MATLIQAQELKADFSAVLARVEAGEKFIITRDGNKVAKLVPVDATASGQRRLGFLDYKLPDSFFDELPAEDVP